MFPSLAGDNRTDTVRGYIVFPRELSLRDVSRRMSCANIAHIVGCQFAWMSVANLDITHIVRLRSYIEMIRSYAGWVVTYVKDTQASRDCSVMNDPRRAMCADSALARVHAELTVSELMAGASPDPAIAGLVNFLPETISNRTRAVRNVMREAAVLACPVVDLPRMGEKGCSTVEANGGDGTLLGHRKLLTSVAMPGDVNASLRLLRASILPHSRAKNAVAG